jgi:hypothetical protein
MELKILVKDSSFVWYVNKLFFLLLSKRQLCSLSLFKLSDDIR